MDDASTTPKSFDDRDTTASHNSHAAPHAEAAHRLSAAAHERHGGVVHKPSETAAAHHTEVTSKSHTAATHTLHAEAVRELSSPSQKRPAVEAHTVAPEHHRSAHAHISHSTHNSDEAPRHGGFGQNGFWAKREADYYAHGQILVLEGDTNESIAKRVLEMRGRSTRGADPIPDERDRIMDLNLKYPEFKKEWDKYHHFIPGQVLDVVEPRIGPDINTSWDAWHQAKPGAVNYVARGERLVAVPGSTVVVEPGGAAILQPGSNAFAARNTYVESQPGSVVVSGGHVTAMEGSKVIPVGDPDVTIESQKVLDPRLPHYFPS